MSKIVLIGGHGKIALLAEPLLAGAGHTVDAVIRDPSQAADVEAAGANPVVASVEDADADSLVTLFEGADVVVWSAGAGGGDAARTTRVDRDAAILSIDAAVAAGVPRYVMVSYFGARLDHGVPEDNSFYSYAEAKAAADDHLKKSSLDWTILAPSALTLDAASGTIEVDAPQGSISPHRISRANVAAVLAVVVDSTLSGITVRCNDGATPIAEALASLERS